MELLILAAIFTLHSTVLRLGGEKRTAGAMLWLTAAFMVIAVFELFG